MDRVLIVDDDHELVELLEQYLSAEGYAVTAVFDGRSGVERALSEDHSLIVLDVMLPGLNGFDVLRQIREHAQVPVIMLTARGQEVDRIVGLELGADDYLAKPFNPRELVARMRAVLRRSRASGGTEPEASTVVVGDLSLDPGSRVVRRAGAEIELTGIEFAVLEALMRAAGQIVSRDELSRQALGRRASSYDRSLDVHVSNLRKKLGPAAGERERIKTVRGVGYQYLRPAGESGQEPR
jgi:two-component system response regulator CpxR